MKIETVKRFIKICEEKYGSNCFEEILDRKHDNGKTGREIKGFSNPMTAEEKHSLAEDIMIRVDKLRKL